MSIFDKITSTYRCNFDELVNFSSVEVVKDFSEKSYAGYCKTFSKNNYLLYYEWILRHYQASKKIVLASLFFTQAKYLLERKTRNLSFYSMYYALFNAYSTNIVLLPYLPLEKVSHISHSNIFKTIPNYFNKYGIYDDGFMNLLNRLRLTREAYSYRLPLGGSFIRKENEELNIETLFNDLSDKLPIVLQLSELLSYLSYFAWNKMIGKVANEYDIYQSQCDSLFFSFIEIHDHLGKYCLIDDDDYSRQGWVLKNFTSPFPLSWVTTEKICEDLECGWDYHENGEEENDYDINEVGRYIASCIG